MTTEPTVTPTEAASLLGLTDRSIRRRIKKGQLKAEAVAGRGGSEFRITLSEIERYRAANPEDYRDIPQGVEAACVVTEDGAKVPADGGKTAVEKETRETILRRRASEAERKARILQEMAADRRQIVEELRADLQGLPPISVAVPARSRDTHRPRTLVLHLSDIHVGQLFERGDGLGQYNLERFTLYVTRIRDKVMAFADDLRAGGPIDRLVIVFGGDMIDGRDIHPGHDHQSRPLREQFRVGTEVFAQALLGPLAAYFAEIIVVAVPGNHGRLGKKGQFDLVQDSLDLLFMDLLQARLEAIDNIHWHPWESWFSWFTLHGHSFFVAHGDAFKAWLGIPFYGAIRYKSRIESLINHTIDVFMVGHHHASAEFPLGWGKISMNGSFPGTGEFGSFLGLGGPPLQRLLLVSDDYAVAGSYELHLASKDELLTVAPANFDALGLFPALP